jgi:hypothetical protein
MDKLSDNSTAAPADSPSSFSPLRTLAAFGLLLIGAGILAVAMSGDRVTNNDFISYWAAGKQLVHHGNPYDASAILRIQQSAGYTATHAFFMRNTPFAFFLALPLGFFGATVGGVVWSMAMLAALIRSIWMLWVLHGRPSDRLHLLGYCFPPVFACLLTGQMGMFLLLGVVLFLYFHQPRPLIAGAALLLCALKPHLFLPVLVALIAWIVTTRTYRIVAGAAIALTVSLALPLFLDPGAWTHYLQMMRAANIQDDYIPTLSLFFRLAVDRNLAWLQFVPAFFGGAWALWYFFTRRNQWSWMQHGSLLLLVSVLVAPYAWPTDQVVLLPAILRALYFTRSRTVMFLFIAASALVEIEVFSGIPIMHSAWYLWTTPAWLALYLYAVRARNIASDPQAAIAPATVPLALPL